MFNKYSPELSSLTSNEGALETVLTKRPPKNASPLKLLAWQLQKEK